MRVSVTLVTSLPLGFSKTRFSQLREEGLQKNELHNSTSWLHALESIGTETTGKAEITNDTASSSAEKTSKSLIQQGDSLIQQGDKSAKSPFYTLLALLALPHFSVAAKWCQKAPGADPRASLFAWEALKHLYLDKGYRQESVRGIVQERYYVAHIQRIGEKKDDEGRKCYRRWVRERTLGWFSQCCVNLVRYEKKASNYLGLIKVACIRLWYRRQYRLFLLR